MDGAGDRWAADAPRSAGSRGVRPKPFSGRSAALTRSSPLPHPPSAARGRSGRGEVDPRVRRQGSGGGGGAAAARNAVAVAGDSEGFPGLFVEREDRRSGGGGGVGGFESKRRLAPPPGRPPPKRRALSATRRFQPGCGGETAAHLVVRSGSEDGLRVGASPSHGGFSMLERATTGARLSCAGDGGTDEGGLLLEAAIANAGLVLPEKGGASSADGFRPKATVVKPSDASGFAGFVVTRGRGAWSDKLGEKELVPILQSPLNRDMVRARARPAHSLGLDTVAPLDSGGGGEMGLLLDIQPAVGGLDASEEVIARHDSGCMACRCAMDVVEATNKDALDGPIVCQELEEGEIAATLDIAEATGNDALDVPIEAHELEEGEIAATMDIVKVVNKDPLDGAVEPQGLEKGEVDATMDIVESKNKRTLDGAMEVQELDEDEIAVPMHILESTNKQNFDGAVEVQEFEESEIDATMDTMEAMNKNMLVGAVEGQELEGKIAAKGHGQERENCDIATKVHGQKPVDGDTATRYGQEPENGEIAAKGHGQEPVDGETVTRSDHIVQESQFVVDFMPRNSTDSFMRSKMRLAARKTLRPHVKANQTKSDHIVKESQFAADGIPRDSTGGIMRSNTRLTARKTVWPPVNANQMSLLTTPDRPFSTIRESFATMKKFKAAQSKPVHVNTASTSALANKEKRTFEFLFVSKDKAKDKKAFYLEGDDILKAAAVHEGKLLLYVNVPSGVRSVWHHRQHVGRNTDARRKVRMMSRRFQFLCRFIALAVEQRLLEVPRVDLAADKVIKEFPDCTKHESIVSKVAGVEVGNKFLFRAELAIVGLHRPYRAGIDACKDNNGVHIALSVVASGGYLDELSSSGELIYTGSGGKAAGTAEQDGDQKLQRGNLALKNCIATKTPVRVIHGFKSRNREDGSHSKGKEISIYIYDGLYIVVGCWQEGIPGSRVFKYRLRRIPGQPELPLHVTKWIRKSALHPDSRPREREAEPGGGSGSTGDGWRGCRSAQDGLRLKSR